MLSKSGHQVKGQAMTFCIDIAAVFSGLQVYKDGLNFNQKSVNQSIRYLHNSYNIGQHSGPLQSRVSQVSEVKPTPNCT